MAISFGDIIALAKAGYSVSDVKELMNMGQTNDSTDTDNLPVSMPPNNDTGEGQTVPTETAPVSTGGDKKEEPDYKALYEQAQKDLKDAQANNRNTDVSNKTIVDKQSEFEKIVATFM